MATTKKRRNVKPKPKQTRHRFKPEVKAEAVRRVHAGESVAEVAESIGASAPSLYAWLSKGRQQVGERVPSKAGVVLYPKQEAALREAAAYFLEERGVPVDKSMLIRFAVNTCDFSEMPDPI